MDTRLTAAEKDMLAFMARDPDRKAWRAHYRLLKLPKYAAPDIVVTRRLNRLRARPDAKIFLEQQRRETDNNRVAAMREADGAGWDRERARVELEQKIYELAAAAVDEQLEKLAGDGKAASPNQLAKLIEQGARLAGQTSGGSRLSTEQLRESAKELGFSLPGTESMVVPVATPRVADLPEAKA